MLTFWSSWVNTVPLRRLSKAAQWDAAPGITSWWNLPLPARGRRREAACETVPEMEREDLPGKLRAEKQACPRSGARRRCPHWNEKSQTGAERHQVVLSEGQWSKHTWTLSRLQIIHQVCTTARVLQSVITNQRLQTEDYHHFISFLIGCFHRHMTGIWD